MPGSLVVSGMSAGELAGQRIIGPISVVGKSVIGETVVVPMLPGDNSVAVPEGSVAVLIIGPRNGTVPLTVRTSLNAGDAGMPINEAANPFMYTFPPVAPTSLIFHSSAVATSGGVSITF